MAPQHVRRGFLRLLKNTINRLAVPIARSGYGPFALVRHVGRRTGLTYETPLVLARVADGFVAELTYGPNVDWYRNVTAAPSGRPRGRPVRDVLEWIVVDIRGAAR